MSKSDAWENGLLQLIFNGVAVAGLAQNHTTPSDLYLSLHSADPGDVGTLATNEVTTAMYDTYARKQLARTTANFTVTGNAAALAASQDFPACTAGTGITATHWGIGPSSGLLLYKGAISPTIAIAAGVTPRINAGTFVTEE